MFMVAVVILQREGRSGRRVGKSWALVRLRSHTEIETEIWEANGF